MKDGEFNPEYIDAGALQLAYAAGFLAILYIGANIHLVALCIALNLGFGLASVFVWGSGAAPPFFFGRGWRTVRDSEDAELFWLNLGVLILGFAASVVGTMWVVVNHFASAA